jgi:hypothetical protein
LTAIGEDDPAAAWCGWVRPYSEPLARWAVGELLAHAELEHGLRAVVRHARLVAVAPERAGAHAPGSLARQIGLAVRALTRAAPAGLRDELDRLLDALRGASRGGDAFEAATTSLFGELWNQAPRGA